MTSIVEDNFGSVDSAYHIGRSELLEWLNSFLSLNYEKVEQCANGAAHCQLMDALFPGKVPLHRVKFNAKFEHERVANLKLLQSVFIKNKVRKHIDIARLARGKYQDNLEFLQWMKAFFERNFQPHPQKPYNPRERRRLAKLSSKRKSAQSARVAARQAAAVQKVRRRLTINRDEADTDDQPTIDERLSSSMVMSSSSSISNKTRRRRRRESLAVSSCGVPPANKRQVTNENNPSRTPINKRQVTNDNNACQTPRKDKNRQLLLEQNRKQLALIKKQKTHIERLNASCKQLKTESEVIEQERGFYFEKLREIEILCQQIEQNGNTNVELTRIMAIMYDED